MVSPTGRRFVQACQQSRTAQRAARYSSARGGADCGGLVARPAGRVLGCSDPQGRPKACAGGVFRSPSPGSGLPPRSTLRYDPRGVRCLEMYRHARLPVRVPQRRAGPEGAVPGFPAVPQRVSTYAAAFHAELWASHVLQSRSAGLHGCGRRGLPTLADGGSVCLGGVKTQPEPHRDRAAVQQFRGAVTRRHQ